MKISICTSVYNGARFIDELWNNLLNQTYKDFVWITIDDGSEDETYYILKQIQKDNPEKVKLYKSKYRKEGWANKFSYADRDSDILVNLDVDDILHPKALEIIVKYLDKNPSVGWVYTQSNTFNPKTNMLSWYEETSYAGDYISIHKGGFLDYNRGAGNPTEGYKNPTIGHVMATRANIWFDNNIKRTFPLYVGEEMDMGYWLETYGDYHVLLRPLHYYRVSDNTTTRNDSLWTVDRCNGIKDDTDKLYSEHLSFRKENNITVKQPINPPTKEQHLLGISLCWGNLQFQTDSKKIGISANYEFEQYDIDYIKQYWEEHEFIDNFDICDYIIRSCYICDDNFNVEEEVKFLTMLLNKYKNKKITLCVHQNISNFPKFNTEIFDKFIQVFSKSENYNAWSHKKHFGFITVNQSIILTDKIRIPKLHNSLNLKNLLSTSNESKEVKVNKEIKIDIELKDNNINEQYNYWNNVDNWEEGGHEWSKFFGGTLNLWNNVIFPRIKKYLHGDVLEIAPGQGRITKYLLDCSTSLEIVDLSEECIQICREKFGDKIKYNVTDGKSLQMIKSCSKDLVFSWDSFVHMHSSVIDSYLNDICKILKPTGYVILHHSYLAGGEEKSFNNIGGRSNMTPEHFKSLAEKNNLSIVNQENIITHAPTSVFKNGITDTISICRLSNNTQAPIGFSYKLPTKKKVEEEISYILRPRHGDVNKKVCISFESKSIGDTLAWIPYVEEYRKKHNCNVICSTFWNKWFINEYKEIEFVEPSTVVHNIDNFYQIGWFWDKRNPRDVRTIPLQQTAADILKLDYKEIKPRVSIPDKKSDIEGKYVCISIQSTLQCKYWNWSNGWDEIVRYLKSFGYKIVCIDRDKLFGIDGQFNEMPKGVIDKTGNIPLEERMITLKFADFFIGIGSGLSWLSWSVGTPVIMISSFSKPFCEFQSNCIRLYNENESSGYFNNKDFILDIGDWNWNPLKECKTLEDWHDFETITPQQVKNAVDEMIVKIEKRV